MQSFNTQLNSNAGTAYLDVCPITDLPPGKVIRIELSDGLELAVYNIDGEFYATDNFCPHRGAPLSEGFVSGHIVECGLHGWQFDVRTGNCLTVTEKIRTYEVIIDDGLVKVLVRKET